MAMIDLKHCTITIKDADSPVNSLEIHVGSGSLNFSESRTVEYILDRGLLYGVREGDEQPVDVSFSIIWEFLKSEGAELEVTPKEIICGITSGQTVPLAFVSTGSDPCEPYACDILISNNLECFSYTELYPILEAGDLSEIGLIGTWYYLNNYDQTFRIVEDQQLATAIDGVATSDLFVVKDTSDNEDWLFAGVIPLVLSLNVNTVPPGTPDILTWNAQDLVYKHASIADYNVSYSEGQWFLQIDADQWVSDTLEGVYVHQTDPEEPNRTIAIRSRRSPYFQLDEDITDLGGTHSAKLRVSKVEEITLPEFRYEKIDYDPKAGTLNFSGKCNRIVSNSEKNTVLRPGAQDEDSW